MPASTVGKVWETCDANCGVILPMSCTPARKDASALASAIETPARSASIACVAAGR